MREYLVFMILLLVKVAARLFYRIDMRWLGTPGAPGTRGAPGAPGVLPLDPWRHIRLVAFLNHTSLYESLFASGCPNHFLWRLARHGVIPIARKTADRAVVGRFYGLVAKRVISITRERDETWREVLRTIDPDAMVIILPEGRMKRANGLDSEGKPMTVRGGVADIIETIGEGRMLLAYSGGLHHVQMPGERFPRLFKTVRMNLEVVDIGTYRDALLKAAGHRGFKRAVVEDMEQRRDTLCPREEPAPARRRGTT